MKKNIVLKSSVGEETAKKFAYICKSENISIENSIAFLIRQKISYFERVKGKITPKDTENVIFDETEE